MSSRHYNYKILLFSIKLDIGHADPLGIVVESAMQQPHYGILLT